MALETLKITESGLKYYVLEKVTPQMGKSRLNAPTFGKDPTILDRYLDRLKYCYERRIIKTLTGLGRDGRI